MGINQHQLRDIVIRPTLKRIGLWNTAAEQLVLGTAIQESSLQHLQQLGGGPALGLWQMEPATHNDIWQNFLHFRPKLGLNVLDPYSKLDPTRLVWDLAYACAMCRVHYLRSPSALPVAGDTNGQAVYWKQFYNTPLGAGTVEEYIANWHRVMGHD